MIEKLQPPVAKIIPTELEKFGDVRIDNYFWLNDRENPEVIDYLNKENDYYQQMTAHTQDFQVAFDVSSYTPVTYPSPHQQTMLRKQDTNRSRR